MNWDRIDGELLKGRIQELYGVYRDQADKRLRPWQDYMFDDTTMPPIPAAK